MGIAYGSRTLDEIGGEAQNNLDVALVRGGDQVVVKEVKEGAKPVYYGGKSAKNVKRTRVRSRAMSTALRRIFDETGDVFIMGHKFPDMDALALLLVSVVWHASTKKKLTSLSMRTRSFQM